MSLFETRDGVPRFTRRGLLIGAATTGGLVAGWLAWPRSAPPNLVAAPGEHILDGWVKVGSDGHVTVAVPQAELGQGAYTLIAQAVADQLGADWRTVAIEPAPLNPLYANEAIAAQWRTSGWHGGPVQATGGSTTLAAFRRKAQSAGATARALLCMAAAKRFDADWRDCETEEGFVVYGAMRIRFGELAAEAAQLDPPEHFPYRTGAVARLAGTAVPRLDIPSKIDGSANFASDIRHQDMVFAAIRQGPIGDSRPTRINKAAAMRIPGVLDVLEHERWVAAVAGNWWAANRAVDALRPRFVTDGKLISDKDVTRALDLALGGDGYRIVEGGDLSASFKGASIFTARYSAGLAPHAALEPVSATARYEKGRMEIWIATQLPGAARAAAAREAGISEAAVVIHNQMAGGSFGRRYESEVAGQAAWLAMQLKRPVQLVWSRAEDMMHDRFRPPARAKLAARITRDGGIDGLLVKIAAPDGVAEMLARQLDGKLPHKALAIGAKRSPAAVDGAVPPYAIPNLAVDHYPADIGVPTGKWRSGAHSYSCFFTESFVDELAQLSGNDPFLFRMGLLSGNTRLAQCLSKATSIGGWEGGSGEAGQGIACHSMLGSHVAVMAEARLDENQKVRVAKLVCVADLGRIQHPDIARQQIEGGLLFGMAAAVGAPVSITRGIARPQRFGGLGFPALADAPEVIVELIRSEAEPGAFGELAVPPVAPAIANAIAASSGRRLRSLPLSLGR